LKDWLQKNGVSYKEIVSDKPFYALSIDDRSLAPDFLFILSRFLRRARLQKKGVLRREKRGATV